MPSGCGGTVPFVVIFGLQLGYRHPCIAYLPTDNRRNYLPVWCVKSCIPAHSPTSIFSSESAGTLSATNSHRRHVKLMLLVPGTESTLPTAICSLQVDFGAGTYCQLVWIRPCRIDFHRVQYSITMRRSHIPGSPDFPQHLPRGVVVITCSCAVDLEPRSRSVVILKYNMILAINTRCLVRILDKY